MQGLSVYSLTISCTLCSMYFLFIIHIVIVDLMYVYIFSLIDKNVISHHIMKIIENVILQFILEFDRIFFLF